MKIVNLIWLSFYCFLAHAQATSMWSEKLTQAKASQNVNARAQAKNAHYLQINTVLLNEHFSDKQQVLSIEVPMPNGTIKQFLLTPSPIMSAPMTAKYPQMMTYTGVQKDNPANIGRFSISTKGLFGLFLQHHEWVLLSPQYSGDRINYISYYYKDAIPLSSRATKRNDVFQPATPKLKAKSALFKKSEPTGDAIRTFLLAVSVSGEYTQEQGGTKQDALEEVMMLVNRVNQILLTDVAVQFELVMDESIIFTDPQTDPFTNIDSDSDLETNQQVIDDAVGSSNYDIGHMLNTNGGGLASLGAVCDPFQKAQGYTGSDSPMGERFYIDLVIHEFGHQLGANHTFNADNSGACTGEGNSDTSFEPGSGSTIMGYAGICDEQNIQNISDPYYHSGSIEEIRDLVSQIEGNTCGTLSPIANAIPQVQISRSEYTIPTNSPFLLSASATDADNDNLNYSWEQIDAGGELGATHSLEEISIDNGANPLFRSFSPSSQSTRYFPQLSDVLLNRTRLAEAYPTTDREMNFRLTVRDNKSGVNSGEIKVNVVDTGTVFSVTSPQSSARWPSNSQQTVNWNSAGTEQAPINCQSVDISLDLDGDENFTIVLSATPNDGEQVINVPNTSTDSARLMVQCSDNIFYAINDGAFKITANAEPIAPIIEGQQVISTAEDTQVIISLNQLNVTDPDSTFPEGFSLRLESGMNYTVNGAIVTPDNNFNGVLSVGVAVNDGALDSNIFLLNIQVPPVNDPPVANNDSASVLQDSSATLINVIANDTDIEGDELTLDEFTYSGNGQVSISDNQISYTPASGFAGNETISYTISDGQTSASANISIDVNALPPPPPPPPPTSNDSGGGSIAWLILCLFGLFIVKLLVPVNRISKERILKERILKEHYV